MAWAAYFPQFTDEVSDSALAGVSPENRERYLSDFAIAEVLNPTSRPHVIALSLFYPGSAEQGIVDESLLRGRVGEDRPSPWELYFEPLLKFGPELVRDHQDIGIVIFLAADLIFLAARLARFCEVRIMRTRSAHSCPGILWRLLALESNYGSVTILDADLMATALIKVRLTQSLKEHRLGWWRAPVPRDFFEDKINYRPVAGCYWGTHLRLKIRDHIVALRHLQETRPNFFLAIHPKYGRRRFPLLGSAWPEHFHDEFFLGLVVYPRLASAGTLTLLATGQWSDYLALDIEYVTSASPRSEISYDLHRIVARNLPPLGSGSRKYKNLSPATPS